MADGTDYIKFGRDCIHVCTILSQVINGKLDDFSQAWGETITQLTTWVI